MVVVDDGWRLMDDHRLRDWWTLMADDGLADAGRTGNYLRRRRKANHSILGINGWTCDMLKFGRVDGDCRSCFSLITGLDSDVDIML